MILIEYSSLAISSYIEDAMEVDSKITEGLYRHILLNNIRHIKTKFGKEYGKLVFAIDSEHYWRKDYFEHYKANRKKSREKSDLDWNFIFSNMTKIKLELKEFFPYHVIESHGAEADDVIAVLAEHAKNKEKVLIVSRDKDFIQLQRYNHVKQFSKTDKKFIEPSTTAEAYLQEHIIKGDVGDGIPNILSDDDTFVASDKRQGRMTQQRIEKFLQNIPDELKQNYERNSTLIDFQHIPEIIKRDIIDAYDNYQVKDSSMLFTYFTEKRLSNLLSYIGDF